MSIFTFNLHLPSREFLGALTLPYGKSSLRRFRPFILRNHLVGNLGSQSETLNVSYFFTSYFFLLPFLFYGSRKRTCYSLFLYLSSNDASLFLGGRAAMIARLSWKHALGGLHSASRLVYKGWRNYFMEVSVHSKCFIKLPIYHTITNIMAVELFALIRVNQGQFRNILEI